MDKNWLIRTKSNHILGPITKDKVLELYHNGSIKPDDEVCSGNGYWFFIREEDLIERFLTGSDIQGFNPISEAKDVLTSTSSDPGAPKVKEDITMVGALNLSLLNQPKPNTETESSSDSHPESAKKPSTVSSASSEVKKKNNVDQKLNGSTKKTVKLPKNQSFIKYLGLAGFVLLLILVYYRKTIIRHLFSGEMTFSVRVIDTAVAQEEPLPEKKNSLMQ